MVIYTENSIDQMETDVHVHFKFAHVLKLLMFCVMYATEDSSLLCNTTPINLLSARDRLCLVANSKLNFDYSF